MALTGRARLFFRRLWDQSLKPVSFVFILRGCRIHFLNPQPTLAYFFQQPGLLVEGRAGESTCSLGVHTHRPRQREGRRGNSLFVIKNSVQNWKEKISIWPMENYFFEKLRIAFENHIYLFIHLFVYVCVCAWALMLGITDQLPVDSLLHHVGLWAWTQVIIALTCWSVSSALEFLTRWPILKIV